MGTGTEFQFKEVLVNYAVWAVALVVFVMLVLFICKKFMRISQTEDLPENCADMRLYGVVTGISDGDGFRFFHYPWLRSRSYTSEDSRLYVRLAGIDAPEMGNSHMPGQPFAKESKEYLRSLIQGKNIKIKVVGVDQYNRVLAVAYLPRWFLKPFLNTCLPINFFGCFQMDFLYTNVNLEMVKYGYACVYTGRDAIYDEYKEALISLEKEAKRRKKGMWMYQNSVTPMRHKRIHRV